MGLISKRKYQVQSNPTSFAYIFVSFTFVYVAKTILVTQAKWKFSKEGFTHKYASRTITIIEEKKILLRHNCNATSYISRNGESNQMYRCICKPTDYYRQLTSMPDIWLRRQSCFWLIPTLIAKLSNLSKKEDIERWEHK